jgi:hypothetical protein
MNDAIRLAVKISPSFAQRENRAAAMFFKPLGDWPNGDLLRFQVSGALAGRSGNVNVS